MAAYIKKIARRDYPFPQADRPDRVIDVVALVCDRGLDDDGLAAAFGIHPRQGRYYADAAAYLGLIRHSGGYWRPELSGRKLNGMPTAEKPFFVGALVAEKPVFHEVVIHLATHGFLPPADEVQTWIMAEDQTLNHETASRRARTVLSWVEFIREHIPETAHQDAQIPVELVAQAGRALPGGPVLA